jgi:hypothetical protein
MFDHGNHNMSNCNDNNGCGRAMNSDLVLFRRGIDLINDEICSGSNDNQSYTNGETRDNAHHAYTLKRHCICVLSFTFQPCKSEQVIIVLFVLIVPSY